MLYIFVETNFLLTLTLKQNEYLYAYKLLRLAEARAVTLCIPSFCIAEAYSSLLLKRTAQEKVKRSIDEFLNQAIRGSHSRNKFSRFSSMRTEIDKKLDKELKMLDANVERVLAIATSLAHDRNIHRKGILMRTRLDLKDEMDAFILASIDTFIINSSTVSSKYIFVTEDAKTIANKPEVRRLMSTKGRMLFTSYKECIEHFRALGII